MPIIPETPPPAAMAAESVIAYQAFAENHDRIPSFWTDAEVQAFVELAAQMRRLVRQTGPETWTLTDPRTHEERRFSSAVAAGSWLDRHPVSA